MEVSVTRKVIKKPAPAVNIVSESKVEFEFENFEYYELDEIIKEEILTPENLICSIEFCPLYCNYHYDCDCHDQSHAFLSIKGFGEAIWKSGKHQLQVTASVEGQVVADSGLMDIVKEDFVKVLDETFDRQNFFDALTEDGSLVLTFTVTIFGPDSSGFSKFISLNNNSEVVKLNSKIFESGAYSDFTITVQKQKFKVHRNILAAASPVFDKMFSVDMTESKSKQCQVKDIKPRIFKHLLEFIYAGKVPEDIGDVAKELFEAAHYYEIEKLKEICKKELPDKLTAENAMETYKWAWTYELEELKLAAWKIIKRDIIKDFTLSDQEMPPAETIQEILDHKNKFKELFEKFKRFQIVNKESAFAKNRKNSM